VPVRQAYGRTPLEGAVSVTLRLWFPDRRRRDLDNVAKSVLDGLNGVAYADDSQIRYPQHRRRQSEG
jgi:crossover junction endodeoxyribonuclease RusA